MMDVLFYSLTVLTRADQQLDDSLNHSSPEGYRVYMLSFVTCETWP